MSYSCTSLGSVRRLGQFEWYIFLLQDGLSDQLRSEIENNFDLLGRSVGEEAVVIRGYDPQRFRREVQEAYAGMYPRLQRIAPPALFVTDLSPAGLSDPQATGRFMIFPLSNFRQDRGSVANFLSSMVDALGSPDALTALATAEPGRFERHWQWLRRYLTMQPAFMGFGVNLDLLTDDAAQTLDRWFPAGAS